MNSSKKSFSTKEIILIGLFSAICYITLIFKIPVPAPVGKPFLHMGNMVVILAALLFSGPIGGLSGAIGMGLFDLLNGWASTAPKTIVLKFGIGIVVGYVASLAYRKDAKSPIRYIILAALLLITTSLTLFFSTIFYGHEISVLSSEKALVIIPALYIFCLILGIGLAIVCFYIKHIELTLQYAILGAVLGIVFNLIGEFIFGVFTLLLLGNNITTAVINSFISLPATLLNGSVSIIVAILLYIPLRKYTRHLQNAVSC